MTTTLAPLLLKFQEQVFNYSVFVGVYKLDFVLGFQIV